MAATGSLVAGTAEPDGAGAAGAAEPSWGGIAIVAPAVSCVSAERPLAAASWSTDSPSAAATE